MRLGTASVLAAVLATGASAAPESLYTASGAVLCTLSDNVPIANDRRVLPYNTVLKRMGCFRSPAGVPITVLGRSESDQPWMIRFFPRGISGGVVMYGLPHAFGKSPAPVSTTVREMADES
jgi:hypothetical protein